jgi:hypothetical protein
MRAPATPREERLRADAATVQAAAETAAGYMFTRLGRELEELAAVLRWRASVAHLDPEPPAVEYVP